MKKTPASSKKNIKAKSKSLSFKTHLKRTRSDAKRVKKLTPEPKEMKTSKRNQNQNHTPSENNPNPKDILATVLQEVHSVLETLPKALQTKVEDLATSTLSRVIT